MLNYNEDRICIVTNLTKTSNKQKQISFFGVYDGNGGVNKADFLRDNFHLFLVQDIAVAVDMELVMKKTLQRLGQMFNEDYRFKDDQSTVSFVIAVIASNTLKIQMRKYIICNLEYADQLYLKDMEKISFILHDQKQHS